MKKILLILPYFGNLNASGFFPLFLQSCRKNESIDFLLLTDDITEYDYPTNVHVVMTTFQAVRERFQRHFLFPISLERPYKLCDFRMTYGELFAEEIKGYDAWGFCDHDLVFGNLRAYLTEDRLERYGRIYLRGHLSVFRADIPPDFYKQPLPNKPDYLTVLSDPTSFAFDEWFNRNPECDSLRFSGYESYTGLDNFDISPPSRTCPSAFTRAQSTRNPNITEQERYIHHNVLFYSDGKMYRIGIINGGRLIKDMCGTIIAAPNYFANAPEPQNCLDVLKLQADITRADYLVEAVKRKMHSLK